MSDPAAQIKADVTQAKIDDLLLKIRDVVELCTGLKRIEADLTAKLYRTKHTHNAEKQKLSKLKRELTDTLGIDGCL